MITVLSHNYLDDSDLSEFIRQAAGVMGNRINYIRAFVHAVVGPSEQGADVTSEWFAKHLYKLDWPKGQFKNFDRLYPAPTDEMVQKIRDLPNFDAALNCHAQSEFGRGLAQMVSALMPLLGKQKHAERVKDIIIEMYD